MNALALTLFLLLYTPHKHPVPQFPVMAPVVEVVPQPSVVTPVPAPAEPTVPTYTYTCPDGGWPIGDGQCHINNDRPGDVVK